MGANQILQEIKESGVAGEQFWYIYALVVTALLALLVTAIIFLVKGFLTKFLTDIKETNKELAGSITKLTTMVQLHDLQLEHLDEDVKEHERKIEDLIKRRTK